MDLTCVFEGICHLGEGPIWNVQKQKLFWTDIFNRKIWVYDPSSNASSLYWKGGYMVGGFAFTRSGGVVLCTDKGVYLLEDGAEAAVYSGDGKYAEPVLLFDIDLSEDEMFNDITVDPQGRIFAGTVKRPHFTGGTLYRLERGKDPEAVLKGVYCSNGMTFSLDRKYFYHTDSTRNTIKKYYYDQQTGEIGNPRIFYHGTPEAGLPDGITLDSEDHVWAAFWGGSCIRRLDPDGVIAAEIKLPAKQVSSVMFGGENLDMLYITSACENGDDISTGRKGGIFLGGPVYACHPGVTGRGEWLADF